MINEDNKSKRLLNGQFKPGESGNPNGRPKSENVRIREQLSEKSGDVVEKVVEAALSGDLQACKIVLDRICPPLKPQSPKVKIDKPIPDSLAEVARLFLNEAANGNLSTDMAGQLIGAVGGVARVVQIDDLKARLESLERSMLVK